MTCMYPPPSYDMHVSSSSYVNWSRHEDTHSVIVQHWADPGILTVVHTEEGAEGASDTEHTVGTEGASDTEHTVDLGTNYVVQSYLQTLLNPSPRAPPRPLRTFTPPLRAPQHTHRTPRAEATQPAPPGAPAA